MASGAHRAEPNTTTDGAPLRVGVITARWNAAIVDRLAAGAARAVDASGATAVSVTVPGSFELPYAAKVLAEAGEVDAIVVIGTVIRGETTHYELVSEGCAQGAMRVQLDTGVPVGLGVLTVENEAQALARSEGPGGHNVGEEATFAAIEMARLRERFRTG